MSQIRQNKVVVPINSDAYNLTGDLAAMADAANVVIPVASQSERDALTKKAGLCVVRTDLPNLPVERCDGTNWIGTAQHAEFTSGSINIPANTLYGPGVYTADTGQTINGGFVTPDIADCLSITQAGLYQISFRVTGGTAIPSGWLEIHSKDDATVYYGNTIAGAGTGGSGGVSVNLYFPAPAIIRLRLYLTSAWTMSGTRARITRLG